MSSPLFGPRHCGDEESGSCHIIVRIPCAQHLAAVLVTTPTSGSQRTRKVMVFFFYYECSILCKVYVSVCFTRRTKIVLTDHRGREA